RLRDFRLKHIGEMPEQETADLQIIGQLQSQLQLQGEALARAEQQKTYLQSMMVQSAPVLEVEDAVKRKESPGETKTGSSAAPPSASAGLKAKLAGLLARYTDKHPEVQKLKLQIEEEEAKEARGVAASPVAQAKEPNPAPLPPANSQPRTAEPVVNRF